MTASLDPSSPAVASAASRQNALSTRITSVLSASYSDLEIRDALATLDQRGFKNTAEARRTLRLNVQEDVVRRNGEILNDFKGVADELRRVETSLSRLSATCAAMRTQIQAANKTTAPILDEASALFVQKKEAETKQHLLQAFQKFFILFDQEVSSLTSTSEPIDSDFFAALKKLKQIHADSRLLLSSSNDRLGLSILDTSSKTLNTAYQKLFRWTQREFRDLNLENPRLSAAMRRALRVLAERPALFNSSLDNFASAREETLSSSFHGALTGQGDEVVGKPIEYQAHDPLRYISDMLAWAHSATVSEREALEVLFIEEGEELAKGIKEGQDNDPWNRHDDSEAIEVYDGRKALNDLVSRDVAGVARQLRQRTEQVVQGQEEAIIAYRIANLLAFYRGTFRKLLGEEAEIINILNTLETGAQRQFRENMSDQVALMKSEIESTPPTTEPPEFLKDALETVKALLKSYETSMTSADPASDVSSVLSASLDPFIEGSKTLWSKLEEPQRSILAVNCLLEVRTTLSPFQFTSSQLSAIDTSLRSHAVSLKDSQHTFFLHTSGLANLITILSPISLTDIPALRKAMDPEMLQSMGQQLDEFLPSALMDAMEEIKGLRSARLAREVTEEAAEQFCDEFEMIEARILAVDEATEENEDDDEGEDEERIRLREMLPRTTEEIRVLLS